MFTHMLSLDADHRVGPHARVLRCVKSEELFVLVPLVIVLAACAAPSTNATNAVPTVASAGSASTPCAFPAPAPAPAALLPAPVYFLGSDSQIWRLGTDGSTLTQITHETAPVRYFDVSPTTGALAYITANTLVCADSLGGGRHVLVEGPVPTDSADESRLSTEMNRLRWSPDGSRVAYGLNGVNLYDIRTATPSVLIMNDAVPGSFATPTSTSLNLYSPGDWSPDGSRLLVNVSFYPEGGGLAILNPADGTLVKLSSPDGPVCCYFAWSSDSKSVYFANDSIGMVASGLWRADAASGSAVTLVAGESNGAFMLVAHPFSLADGQLDYFMATSPALPNTFVPLAMTRSDADGVSNRAALRVDTSLPYEALWSPDGSGALIVDRVGQIVTEQDPFLIYGPLDWLKADASPPMVLPVQGFAIRWGK